MNMIELIEKKRDGGAFAPDEIRWLVRSYTDETIPDYQMSALLMAILNRGMDRDELSVWTEEMLNSGDVLDFSDISAPKVDKHSTGGVGDKVSIPLAPMVAACGIAVPMISGRGLDHTGGTLDKLESIPGFRTDLDAEQFRAVLGTHGLVMAGQSATIAPADRRMYALRDATGTVPSIPLIASSIMSKKLAEGIDGLVLDVKVGSGAFMKDVDNARRLAATMVEIGAAHDTRVEALLTNMDQPLGYEVGNANEMRESIATLRGEDPEDLTEIVLALGTRMLLMGGAAADEEEARSQLQDTIDSGAALDRFAAVIEAQGGDPAVVEDPDLLPSPAHYWDLPAQQSGVVTRCDALSIGRAGVRLGAGRSRKEDDVDHAVGITLLAKVGDPVEAGQPLARIGYNDMQRLADARPLLEAAWSISEEAGGETPLILGAV